MIWIFIFFLMIASYLLLFFKKLKNNRIVIRLPNHLGDTIMVFPLLVSLEKSNIDFICVGKEWSKNLFAGTKYKIIATNKIKYYNFYKIIKKLNREYCILCTNYLSTLLPVLLTNSTIIYNTGFKKEYNLEHQVEIYYKLGKKFIKNNIELKQSDYKIPINSKIIPIGKKIIEQFEKNYIVICPYARNLHKGKNKEWPYWKKFYKTYKKYEIIILVSQDDIELAKSEFKTKHIYFFNLQITAFIMKHAKYVLTNDSGAMHLGSFFGANVIGLFGATDINKTRPWYGQYLVGLDGNFIKMEELIEYLEH
jgi:heptosyltransferase II